MKVAVGLRRVAAGKRTSGRRAAQIARDEGLIELYGNRVRIIEKNPFASRIVAMATDRP